MDQYIVLFTYSRPWPWNKTKKIIAVPTNTNDPHKHNRTKEVRDKWITYIIVFLYNKEKPAPSQDTYGAYLFGHGEWISHWGTVCEAIYLEAYNVPLLNSGVVVCMFSLCVGWLSCIHTRFVDFPMYMLYSSKMLI